MKAMRYFRCIFLLCSISMYSLYTLGQTANNNSIYYLPFSEDWHFGNFTINNWTTETSNWQIDSQIGNDAPAAKFHRTGILSDYSSSLISNTIDATAIKVGRIYLKFDLKLDDYNAYGTEYFKIKVQDSTGWHTIDSINNLGSFDWETYKYDIKEFTKEQTFKFAFECSGQSSLNISDWFIDNIEVYRECDAPEDLTGEFKWFSHEDFGVELIWGTPKSVFNYDKQLTYCNLDNNLALGPEFATEPLDLRVSIKYDNEQLSELIGDTIKSINYFIADSGFSKLIVKVWSGKNGTNLVYSDTATPLIGNWNSHKLKSLITIQKDSTYWFGYHLTNVNPGYKPIGYDDGPCTPGYSDQACLTNQLYWDNVSTFSFNCNWNIVVNISQKAETNSALLAGYNIYRFTDDTSEFVDFIDWNKTSKINNYYSRLSDENSDNDYTICFGIKTVWVKNEDSCVSEYAKTEQNTDKYCSMIYLGENEINRNFIKVWPNPVTDKIKIETKEKIFKTEVYNQSGKCLLSEECNSDYIDLSFLKAGIYILKAETKMGVFTKKFIKL